MNKPFLTIGMAACRDYAGVYFTIQSLRLMHPEVMSRVEILVCDNAPDDPNGKAVEVFVRGWVPNARYIRANEIQGTAYPRDRVFREAKGTWTLCMDSHVMLPPGTLKRLIEWMESNPDCLDLLQGQMVLDDLGTNNAATHFSDTWGAGMWGQWGTDARGTDIDAEPFEIPMHGLGLFCCRTDAWLGFNPRFAGFGGEEGYLHEKYRQAGHKTLCLPFLRWLHKFHPSGVPIPYELPTAWRVRNYLIGFDEIGKDRSEIIREFRGGLTAEEVLNLQMEFGNTPEEWEQLGLLGKEGKDEEGIAAGLLPDGHSRSLS